MPAKFVLKKGNTGKFRFNLHATNGQVIASSEAYDSKQAAVNGIKSVQKNAAGAAVVDETEPAAPKQAAGRTAGKTAKKAVKKTAKKTTRKAPAKRAAAKKSTAAKAAKKTTAKRSTAKKAGTKAVRTVRKAAAR